MPDWLHDILETFYKVANVINTPDIVITEKEQWDAIRKKKKWNSQALI